MLTAILSGGFLAAAILFSMLGQGGGVIYTPVQVLSGIDFQEAATTSLFLIVVVSASSSLVFRKSHKVDLPLVLVLESITALGAFLGGVMSGGFSQATLSAAFAGLVVFAALLMILPLPSGTRSHEGTKAFFRWKRSLAEQDYSVNLALAFPASLLAGGASGLLGVGGGILKVPLMVILLGIPIDIAVGSSAMMVGVTALMGFAGHALHSHWNWRLSLSLAIAVFAGAQIGARFALKVGNANLKRGFGCFLIVVATLMTLKSL